MPISDELILCPKCHWQPDGGAYWECECTNVWDTFSSFGKCPKCGKIHRYTQCIACKRTSPHHDWYVDPPVKLPSVSDAQEQTPQG
ncbi:MAG: hypothetical protein CL946_12175 [Ectothiorhodospiraceae bacterium]|nr:hypothetical protein [Ectothiorhodospiraceae bacterium]